MTDFTKIELLENKIKNLKDDIWCVQHYLSMKDIPTENEKGETYSIVGRINLLETRMKKEFSERETELMREEKKPFPRFHV
jgi:hypothetical protein